MASETNDSPPGSLLEGSGCADDVMVPLHWAPDCRRKSGLRCVRAMIVDIVFFSRFHNASK